jgi:hypothetical protein
MRIRKLYANMANYKLCEKFISSNSRNSNSWYLHTFANSHYYNMKKKTITRIVWTFLASMIIFTMVLWTIGAAFM